MSGRPVVDFDHHAAAYAKDGVAMERYLRRHLPVAWSDHHGGYWVVSRHAEVSACLQDHETFSSAKTIYPDGAAKGGLMIPAVGSFRNVPDDTDPPEWNHFRRLLNPYFAPAAVERMRPRVLDVVTGALDAVAPWGAADLILDIANPVTAQVTLELLGLPLADLELYSQVMHRLSFEPHHPEVEAGMAACRARIMETITSQRSDSAGGLLSDLLDVAIEGEPLNDAVLVDIVVQLLLGGLDTTSALFGHACVHLDRHAEEWERLVENEQYLRIATEELVRWVSPVLGLGRTARRRTVLAGQEIEPGDRVLLLYRSANRDETVFDDPDEVDLGRFPNRHAGFGVGIHRCLGSNLARVVFQTMLRETLRRLPDLRIDHAGARRFPVTPAANGWISIPASFTATPPRQDALHG